MKNFTEQELDRIFSKGTPIDDCNGNELRLDAVGAFIKRSSYGRDDEKYGWEVDHIVPEDLLRKHKVPQKLIDNEINLRPLNWKNNVSKGDDYPKYRVAIEVDKYMETNISVDIKTVIDDKTQEQLRNFYKDYIKL